MEDYEYINQFELTVRNDTKERERLLDHRPFFMELSTKEVPTLAQLTQDMRVEIGRAITNSKLESVK